MNEIRIKKYYREPTQKYNVISVCLFRLEDNYKPIEKYYYGLKELIKLTPKYFPDFYLRIYFDNSIVKKTHSKEIINKEIETKWVPLLREASKLKYVQLVKFRYPFFTTSNDLYHEGLFGTLVRFIPLFDYKSNRNIRNVFVTDIELNDFIISTTRKIYDSFQKSESKFHFRTNFCYDLDPRFLGGEPYADIWQKILAGAMISKMQFPKYLLDDFVTCIKMKNKCDVLNKFLQHKNPLLMSPTQLKLYDKTPYVYGIDELFLNTSFIKYILDHKISFSYTVLTKITTPVYQHYITNNKYKHPKKELIDLYKKIMGKYYDDKKSLEENYHFFDKIIYRIHLPGIKEDRKKIYEYLYNNYYDTLKEINKNNEAEKYGFIKQAVACSIKYKNPYGEEFVMYQY